MQYFNNFLDFDMVFIEIKKTVLKYQHCLILVELKKKLLQLLEISIY